MSVTSKGTLPNPINLMRITGIIEGVSYLVLILIAMPLKYYADMPMAVRITGSVHGLLFVLFMYSIVHAMLKASLSFKHAAMAAIASLLPLATFFLDKSIFDQYRK
jgi:integral membrane protein